MKTLTITKAGQITHGPSQFPTEAELLAHLARHEGMGTYGAEGSYEVLIEDITEKVEQDRVNSEALQYLASTDWQVLRHIRQVALGSPTTLSNDEYLDLERSRTAAAEKIIK
jgi:hypothetical protein